MSDNPDLDARLARLAARKAAAGGAKPDAPEPAPKIASLHVATSDDLTPTPTPAAAAAPKRAKRRHPAAAGRILSVGLSSSAFLSMIAAFGSQPTGAAASASVKTPITRPAARPKIVIKDVHHTIYVDQFGRRIAAPALPKGLAAVPGSKQPPAGAAPGQSSGRTPQGGSPPGAPAWPSSPSGPAPSAPAGGNGGGGASTGPSGPTGPGPAPSPAQPAPGPAPTTPHVTPGPTTPPATSPPVTVVTTPPPPPPPACSGTKCP